MNETKNNTRDVVRVRRFIKRLSTGFRKLKEYKHFKLIVISFVFFIVLTWILRYRTEDFGWDAPNIMYYGVSLRWIFIYLMILIGVLFIVSRPIKAYFIETALVEAGLVDHLGFPPEFVFDRSFEQGKKFYFYSKGVPIEKWRDYQENVETSLNVHIIDILNGRDKREVILLTTSGRFQLQDEIKWEEKYKPKESYRISCGYSYGKIVSISLKDMPHILLAGSTGSGKTFLLKLLLMQLAYKGAKETIVDFKGGMDFGQFWTAHAQILTTIDQLEKHLLELVENELPRRTKMIKEAGCKDIDDFNIEVDYTFPRLILAIDEVAEVLDKKGLKKEQKEKIEKIEGFLSTIARLGRAVGIHVILSMQRPDANVLAGQIKNNIDARICGKAEDTLSMIVLDSTEASRKIPKTSHGLFVNQDGELFRAFLLPAEFK